MAKSQNVDPACRPLLAAWLLSLALICPALISKAAAAADFDPARLPALLNHGRELEDAGRWAEAIEEYQTAVKHGADDQRLYQRLLISRLHYDVTRRFRDDSYVDSLSQMDTAVALDLYSEVLANVQTHYVDVTDWSRTLLHGTAALEAALTEVSFIDHATTAPPAAVERFRQSVYHRIEDRPATTRFDLRATVSLVAKMAETELGISPTVTVMEYVSGAISTLDPYTRLLSPGQLTEMFATIQGNFVGLGVELKAGEDCLQILSVIPGGPADQSGLVPGDRILEVAGTSAADTDPDTVADLLRGEEGSVVTLVVANPADAVRTLRVARRRVEVPCVENVQIVDTAAGVGYLRLTNFQETTVHEIDAALWKLHQAGMRSLVMDLRDNPGGLLSAAVETADRFLDSGRITITRGRNAAENVDYTAHRSGTWSMPMVVLIDRNSASASELFSGAIRDSGRGTVAGELSYGKGRVQGVFRMRSAAFGLCLTTSEFYPPGGQPIDRMGVRPHLEVSSTHIAARPNDAGEIVTIDQDAVLQTAIGHLAGTSTASAPEWARR